MHKMFFILKRMKQREISAEDIPIAEACNCALAEFHDVSSQGPSLIRKDVLHLSRNGRIFTNLTFKYYFDLIE